jgi:FkbM family methyltransferase
MLKRITGVLFAAFAIIAVLFLALEVIAHVNPPRTLQTYYRLERRWDARWPLGHDLLFSLEPAMIRLGVLRPARVEIERGFSLYLDPRDLVPVSILRGGEWQPEIWSSISAALPKNGVFFDVGAHIGYYSLKAARSLGPGGRVLSFEPNPEIVRLLRDNVEFNKLPAIEVVPIACTDRDQTLTLYASETANTGASSLAEANADPGMGGNAKPYQVRGRPIDDVVRELNVQRLDVIKVDVEGAEVYVLRGAIHSLNRFHPKIVAEVVLRQLENMKSSKQELFALLASLGYDRIRPLNETETDWEFVHPSRLASAISVADPSAEVQLSSGFHGIESGAWRWTDGAFRIALRVPEAAHKRGGVLTLRLVAPDVSLKKLGALTIRANVGALKLEPQSYTTEGTKEYRREIPVSALGPEAIEIDFSIDKHLGPPEYSSELGVIALGADLTARD